MKLSFLDTQQLAKCNKTQVVEDQFMLLLMNPTVLMQARHEKEANVVSSKSNLLSYKGTPQEKNEAKSDE